MLDIKCIITIVERGKADKIVEHAKGQVPRVLQLYMAEEQENMKSKDF